MGALLSQVIGEKKVEYSSVELTKSPNEVVEVILQSNPSPNKSPSLTASSPVKKLAHRSVQVSDKIVMAVAGHDSSISYYSMVAGVPELNYARTKRPKLMAGK